MCIRDRTLTGNMHHRVARLTQNVVTSLAPARHLDDVLNVDVLPPEQMPDGGGVLQADEITISSVGEGTKDQAAFEIVAKRNARLEARVLSARADTILFDNSKQQFKMQAESDSRISVTHRTGQAGVYNHYVGKWCEYYRLTDRIRGDFEGLNWNPQIRGDSQ